MSEWMTQSCWRKPSDTPKVSLSPASHRAMLSIASYQSTDYIQLANSLQAFELELPASGEWRICKGGTFLWSGQNEWLLEASPSNYSKLEKALKGQCSLVRRQGLMHLELRGAGVFALLNCGSSVRFHTADSETRGRILPVARTSLGYIPVLIQLLSQDQANLWVGQSYVSDLQDWLKYHFRRPTHGSQTP